MKLTDLRPQLRNPEEPATVHNAWGIEHDCPECKRNGKEHRIWVPFKSSIPPNWQSAPGTSIENFGYSPSVRVVNGVCHGHWNLEAGEIKFHGDSAP